MRVLPTAVSNLMNGLDTMKSWQPAIIFDGIDLVPFLSPQSSVLLPGPMATKSSYAFPQRYRGQACAKQLKEDVQKAALSSGCRLDVEVRIGGIGYVYQLN